MDAPGSISDVQAIRDCSARAQRALLAAGYEYLAGNPAVWPLSPVILAHGKRVLLIEPILPGDGAAAERVGANAQALRNIKARRHGVIAIGAGDANGPQAQEILNAVTGPLAWLDAVGGSFRTKGVRESFSVAPEALRETGLRHLMDPAADGQHADIDCLARLQQRLDAIDQARTFHAQVARSAPRGLLTGANAIMAVCIGLFGLQALMGVNVLNPSIEKLVDWGASYGPLIKAGQWWRLVTNMFLHIGLIHLLFNMYAMYIFGRSLERFQGTWRLVAYFLFGGLAGSVTSLWWSPMVVSAGASGGLFGMVGGMAAVLVRFRRDLPELMRQGLRSWLFTILVYNAVFLMMPAIDGAAHVGGLLGGFLLGLALARSPKPGRGVGKLAIAATAVLLAATTAFGVWAVRSVPEDGPYPDFAGSRPDEIDRTREATKEFEDLQKQLREMYEKTVKEAHRPATRPAGATQPAATTQPSTQTTQATQPTTLRS